MSLPPSFFGIPERTPVGVLHAYNAADVSKELLSGLTMGGRDIATSAVYSIPIATWLSSVQVGVDYRQDLG